MNTNGKKINRVCFLNPQGYVAYPPPLGKVDTGGQTLYVLQLAHALALCSRKVEAHGSKVPSAILGGSDESLRHRLEDSHPHCSTVRNVRGHTILRGLVYENSRSIRCHPSTTRKDGGKARR